MLSSSNSDVIVWFTIFLLFISNVSSFPSLRTVTLTFVPSWPKILLGIVSKSSPVQSLPSTFIITSFTFIPASSAGEFGVTP